MALFGKAKAPKNKKEFDFVQKRVEKSTLFATYVDYVANTEDNRFKGDYDISYFDNVEREGTPVIRLEYNLAEKRGKFIFASGLQVLTNEIVLNQQDNYSIALVEPYITIRNFGEEKVHAKKLITYIDELNSINKVKVDRRIKATPFYDINNLDPSLKPKYLTFACLDPYQSKVVARGFTAAGVEYSYERDEEDNIHAINIAEKAEADAVQKAREEQHKIELQEAEERRLAAEAEAARIQAEEDAAFEAAAAEAEAKAAEAEAARIQAEKEAAEAEAARIQAEKEAAEKAAAEAEAARIQAEKEAAEKAAAEAEAARIQAEKEAAEKAAAEAEAARIQAEKEAAEKAAAEAEAARIQAEKEAAEKAAAEKAAADAKAKAELKAKLDAERVARLRAATEAKQKAKAAADAKAKAEADAKVKAAEEAAAKAAAEAVSQAEKARKDQAKQTMLQMLADKMPVELISKYTGISVEEIKKVKAALDALS